MTDTAPLALQVATGSGNPILLHPPPKGDDSIAALRVQVALALGRHQSQVKLLCSQDILADDLTLSETIARCTVSGEEPLVITAVVSELSIEELRKHIQLAPEWSENPLGYATMEWIDPDNYGRSYRVREGETGQPKRKSTEMTFPAPQDININMLPFVMGEKASLPEEYHHYWPLVEACNLPQHEHGKVGYLTIQESIVPMGQSQRRPGLHIETPGLVMTSDGKYHNHRNMWGCGLLRVDKEHDDTPDLPRVEGGIYMASSVKNSCHMWNALITDPALVTGQHGDLEHIREELGKGEAMRPNLMYWLTDRTPHESLPLQEETYRQFFRLVTSDLSAWFPEHSTANSLGTKPDPSITTIIEGSKFDKPSTAAAGYAHSSPSLGLDSVSQ